MTSWETLAVVAAITCVAAAVVYRRSLARSIIASASAVAPAPIASTDSDPVGDLYRAFAMLEEVGKRQGLARIADQFAGVHASAHQGFIQAALAAPAPAEPPVPKPQGGAPVG